MAAQTVGNLNVVVIGWNDATSHVVSVSDTRGNAYSAALSRRCSRASTTQVIYYAAGIGASAAGANTVTVNFDAAVSYGGRAGCGVRRHQRDDPG